MWTPGKTLEDVEIETIIAAMKYHEQNKTRAAESLKISIRTIDAKLARHEEKKNGRKKTETKDANVRTSSGVRLESHAKPTKEQPVSLQQRDKVQKVLPTKTA